MNDFMKRNVVAIVLVFLLAGSFVFSVCSYMSNKPGERRVLYFQSLDSDMTVCESRYIKSVDGISQEESLVKELLLGPMTNRFIRLFPLGTKVEFCLVEDNTLYVNLSKEALLTSSETCSIRDGVSLLRENVVNNFTNINTVNVFIDGVSVWN